MTVDIVICQMYNYLFVDIDKKLKKLLTICIYSAIITLQ